MRHRGRQTKTPRKVRMVVPKECKEKHYPKLPSGRACNDVWMMKPP